MNFWTNIPLLLSVVILYLLLILQLGDASNSPIAAKRIESRLNRQSRRASIDDYLTPPRPNAPYSSYSSYSTLRGPHRRPVKSRQLSFGSSDSAPAEEPSYISRLASWLNPFGGSPTPPPLPDISIPLLGSPKTPPPWSSSTTGFHAGYPPAGPPNGYPRPPPPPQGSNVYLPSKGKNCNPCNNVPWVPLHGHDDSSSTFAGTGYSSIHQDLRIPDFTYEPPVPAPPAAIPNPLLYPGPMPPLFKARPFVPTSILPTPPPQPPQHLEHHDFNQAYGPGHIDGSDPVFIHSPGDDILPPSSIGEIIEPPTGPTSHHDEPSSSAPYPGISTGVSIQQSHEIHEDHSQSIDQSSSSSSSSSWSSYSSDAQLPQSSQPTDHLPSLKEQGKDVDVVASIASSQSISSIEHPIHYEESAVIEINESSAQPIGLNPPLEEPANSYGTSVLRSSNANDSYGSSSIDTATVQEVQGIDDKDADYNRSSNLDGSSQNHHLVDSYQHQIEEQTGEQVSFNSEKHLNNSENSKPVLVPYKPSSVYVPYPPYPAVSETQHSPDATYSELTSTAITTEEPFLDALMKSYNSFKREMAAKENDENSRSTGGLSRKQFGYGADDTLSSPAPLPVTTPSSVLSYVTTPLTPVKRNKQVQIIIPYTSQHTPRPFEDSKASLDISDDWSGRGPLEQQNQPRKAPSVDLTYNRGNHLGQESRSHEVALAPRPLTSILARETVSRTSAPGTKTGNSIDVLRLQKNIDNWTIQEYSRGMTSSTALPSSSHPYLQPSKKIPEEYLSTSTQVPATQEGTEADNHILSGFNFNDFDHEVSASDQVNRVGSPDERKSADEDAGRDDFWDKLSVSISPHNNERVYVVTPVSVENFEPSTNDSKIKSESREEEETKSLEKEAQWTEKAYQVLPQAVNSLATASTGPTEDRPLWGIMEHEEYTRVTNNTTDDLGRTMHR
ncbi:uncharacterized protein LOC107267622 isoform X2 [Cephus cinctus]|uniref:Uncharacterized protein LOC107267622 isoform X2 n=1 Tax=Cephus cinctus TaxID=211228 RepID=A0AAJ7BUZ2_CEPCN|nr:uncharacterized protein LOC107267622 isoform X2 [Cephus cinctus]